LSNIIYLLEVIHNLYKKVKKSAIKTESRELAWPSCYLLLAKTISLKFIKLPSDTIKAENFRGSWEKKQKSGRMAGGAQKPYICIYYLCLKLIKLISNLMLGYQYHTGKIFKPN